MKFTDVKLTGEKWREVLLWIEQGRLIKSFKLSRRLNPCRGWSDARAAQTRFLGTYGNVRGQSRLFRRDVTYTENVEVFGDDNIAFFRLKWL